MKNSISIADKTIGSFGEEWNKFRYENMADFQTAGHEYFDVVDLDRLDPGTVAADIGCGTGRWLRILAPHVHKIYGVEPSSALEVAIENASNLKNFVPVRAVAEELPFGNETLDFVMSLGVLHHIDKMQKALEEITRVLKPRGTFMFYFYYNLDNRPSWYRAVFRITNMLRGVISAMPPLMKDWVCEFIAFAVYCPMIALSRVIGFLFGERAAKMVPLSYYRNKNLYIIRTDARDRFGTPLEKRFSRQEITAMLTVLGFEDLQFSPREPYWHGVARKAKGSIC